MSTCNAKKALAVLATLPLVLLLTVFVSPAAGASNIEVQAPDQVTVGESVTVTVTVTNAGEPVVGGEVALAFVGGVGGESGWVVVATATTDATGSASLEYLQRALDATRMRVEYFGPDGQENTEFNIVIVDGPQLHQSDAGADIPILGVWWLVVVLAVVWVLIGLAAWRLLSIPRSTRPAARLARFVPRLMVGFIIFTAVGMFVVILTKPESHANLDPGQEFDRTPRALVGQVYEYPGLTAGDLAQTSNELDGRQLYVQAGCASCHSVGGDVGAVGGSIVGEDAPRSVQSLIDEIREGPKGMPAFSEGTLTEAEIEKIFDYLQTLPANS